jgi:hypothetical protein
MAGSRGGGAACCRAAWTQPGAKIMSNFDLERLLNDHASGQVRGFEFFIDPAHDGRGDHIDLHVTMADGGRKYSGLGGAQELREQMPWLQPGQHVNQNNF